MLPMNDPHAVSRAQREEEGCGLGPALLGGWVGAAVLGVLASLNGFGWLAALAFYCLGGSLLVLLIALAPHMEIRLPQPALRPALVRVRRRP